MDEDTAWSEEDFTSASRPTYGAIIQVKAPEEGAEIPLDARTTSIYFTYRGFDRSQSSSVYYTVELLRFGAVLGAASNPNVRLSLNLDQSQQNVGVTAGKYFDSQAHAWAVADSGHSYQYRVTAYQDNSFNRPTVLARGLSGTFAFTEVVHSDVAPVLTATLPQAGAELALGSNRILSIGQTEFDPYEAGSIYYVVELVRFGSPLGTLINPSVRTVLNLNAPTSSFGVSIGSYVNPSTFGQATATCGSGYQYRVTAYKGDWLASPTILASATTESFSIIP